jgi:hypothetical protein
MSEKEICQLCGQEIDKHLVLHDEPTPAQRASLVEGQFSIPTSGLYCPPDVEVSASPSAAVGLEPEWMPARSQHPPAARPLSKGQNFSWLSRRIWNWIVGLWLGADGVIAKQERRANEGDPR